MTLDDLKSWWKHYSPIIKEAKKRNNLNLLNVYVNVCRDNIIACREDIHNEDELKALKIMERALEEALLDASMRRQQETPRQEKEERVETKRTDEGEKTFVERIRERYGRGERREEGEGEIEGALEEECVSGGVKLLNTLGKEVGGRRHELEKNYQNGTSQKNIPSNENDLDNLDRVVYNIEKFIEGDDG